MEEKKIKILKRQNKQNTRFIIYQLNVFIQKENNKRKKKLATQNEKKKNKNKTDGV